jgi:serine/threonine protein kinase
MKEAEIHYQALPEGTVILDGKYRLERLLHQRPRLNLYLGRRLSQVNQMIQEQPGSELPVAIREMVLTDLSSSIREQIEQAAYEEFISPVVLVSPFWPGAGERIYLEGDRHYLVMPLQRAHNKQRINAITLAELLMSRREWPLWLNMRTALKWGMQLCRIVSRLHRLGSVLGDLDPTTILVDGAGTAGWAPVLLLAWPPAPYYWSSLFTPQSSIEEMADMFPIANISTDNPFVAPEIFEGTYDERSDVYSLGAILYLLLTHYAPPSALLRQGGRSQTRGIAPRAYVSNSLEKIELIPPHFLDALLPLSLEGVLLRALELDPTWRYATAFELVEALEAIDLAQIGVHTSAISYVLGNVSHLSKALRWLKREINL